jgi:hypothetical protein
MNQNVVRAGKGDEFKKGVVRTHNVDVWGIAAPEGDPLIANRISEIREPRATIATRGTTHPVQ